MFVGLKRRLAAFSTLGVLLGFSGDGDGESHAEGSNPPTSAGGSKILAVSAALAISLSLAGCANPNSIYRPFRTAEGTGALIDIKQRAILVGQRRVDGRAESISPPVVCAEPSPDSMSAYAAEVAARAENLPLDLTVASQEAAAFTGLRTSAIQLLRDQLFYTCLGYMNGSLSAAQYDLMARRYQKHTVALLAIEQLTGAVKATAVAVETSGTAELARSVSQITEELGSVEVKLAELTKKKADAATSAEERTLIDSQIKQISLNRTALLEALGTNRGALVTGQSKATINSEKASIATAQSLNEVANVVQSIVNNIILADDTPQLCLIRLSTRSEEPAADDFFRFCIARLAQAEANPIKLGDKVGTSPRAVFGGAALSGRIELDSSTTRALQGILEERRDRGQGTAKPPVEQHNLPESERRK